jgi:hypothetical protein
MLDDIQPLSGRFVKTKLGHIPGDSRDPLHRDAKLVSVERYALYALSRKNEVIRDILRHNDASARSAAQVLVHPGHIIEKLPQGFVAPTSQFELAHHKTIGFVYSQDVNPPILDRELDSLLFALLIQSQANFYKL